MSTSSIPTEKGELEQSLIPRVFAGVDEVGKGCLAGPVYAAAVVLDWSALLALSTKTLRLIRDSKTLSPSQRESMVPVIESISKGLGVGHASPAEIDKMGISPATHLAMRRAINKVEIPLDVLLVDGNQKLAGFTKEQRTIVKGDSLCFSIAAASIVAKVERDRQMADYHKRWPQYGFDRHKGYGTKQHREEIGLSGGCEIHRYSFAPLKHQTSDSRV